MKRQRQICEDCGFEEVVERYPSPEEQDDARRRGIPLGPAQCSKCRSRRVVHRD